MMEESSEKSDPILTPQLSSRPFYHLYPEVLDIETDTVDSRPGRVLLAEIPFYPGGGGQPADKGVLEWQGGKVAVSAVEQTGGKTWITLSDPTVEITGRVHATVDPSLRQMMRELHTDTHILNAYVFQHFEGSLVTGVQMYENGTARMDFDLPGADNNALRSLETLINQSITDDLPVTGSYIPARQASEEYGLIRSKSVAPPPTKDGMIRIVEIEGLDRQACGGTHLSSTGRSRPIRILKVENKGRQNRRVKIGLID